MAGSALIDALIHGEFREAFKAPDYFSSTSTGHIFDVKNGSGCMKSDIVGSQQIREIVKVGPCLPFPWPNHGNRCTIVNLILANSISQHAGLKLTPIVLVKDDGCDAYDMRVM